MSSARPPALALVMFIVFAGSHDARAEKCGESNCTKDEECKKDIDGVRHCYPKEKKTTTIRGLACRLRQAPAGSVH